MRGKPFPVWGSHNTIEDNKRVKFRQGLKQTVPGVWY